MFDNLNWWEIGVLLLLALLIFGDKLPNVISDGLRLVRNLRAMANSATSDLSRELGTDIQLEDLHPKAFIRKHLLSEEDEAAIRKPLQGVYDNLRSDLNGVHNELKDVAAAADFRSGGRANGSGPARGVSNSSAGTGAPATNRSPANGSPANGADRRPRGFDLDAT